jgi:hypothetical protein
MKTELEAALDRMNGKQAGASCQPYTALAETDGEDQYWRSVFLDGQSGLFLEKIKNSENILKAFSGNAAQEWVVQLRCGAFIQLITTIDKCIHHDSDHSGRYRREPAQGFQAFHQLSAFCSPRGQLEHDREEPGDGQDGEEAVRDNC